MLLHCYWLHTGLNDLVILTHGSVSETVFCIFFVRLNFIISVLLYFCVSICCSHCAWDPHTFIQFIWVKTLRNKTKVLITLHYCGISFTGWRNKRGNTIFGITTSKSTSLIELVSIVWEGHCHSGQVSLSFPATKKTVYYSNATGILVHHHRPASRGGHVGSHYQNAAPHSSSSYDKI